MLLFMAILTGIRGEKLLLDPDSVLNDAAPVPRSRPVSIEMEPLA